MRIKSLILSMLTISAMCLYPAFSAFAEEIEEPTELNVEDTIILYEDFDNYDVGKWVPFGGGTIFLDNTASHSGDQSLKIKERSNAYDGPSITCDELIIAGEAYMFNGWVYHESDKPETVSWTMKYRDELGSTAYMQIVSADIEPGIWTNLTSSIKIPEEAVEYLIYFECGNAELDFSIDDVTISGAPPQLDESIESKYIEKSVMDFEKDAEQWSERGDILLVHTDEYSKSGEHSLYVTNRTKPWNGASVHITNKIIKGMSYYYSSYVMYNGKEYGNSHKFRMEIQYTLNGVAKYNLVSEKNVKKGKWTELEGRFVVPVEAENVYLYIQTENVDNEADVTIDDTMSFYLDSVIIAKSDVINKENTIKTLVIAVIAAVALVVIGIAFVMISKRIKKNRETLKALSLDAMTGVYNRNTYEKLIGKYEKDEKKYKSLYFGLCDVNFLKYINDNYGHETGDEAIIRCAEMMTGVLGNSGDVYRIGGDEFVCIATEPIKDKMLEATMKESQIDKGYPFEIACGFAQYDSEKYTELKDIITQCDKEMYAHKQEIKAKNKNFSRK